MTDAIRVTDGYPGENKGVLEILPNPWDEDKAMLLVEGSDEWGVKAGSEILVKRHWEIHAKRIHVSYDMILSDKISPILKRYIIDAERDNVAELNMPVFIEFYEKPTEYQIKLVEKSVSSKLRCFEKVCITNVSVDKISEITKYEFVKRISYGGEEGILENHEEVGGEII